MPVKLADLSSRSVSQSWTTRRINVWLCSDRLRQCRGIVPRPDKLARNFRPAIRPSGILIWVKIDLLHRPDLDPSGSKKPRMSR